MPEVVSVQQPLHAECPKVMEPALTRVESHRNSDVLRCMLRLLSATGDILSPATLWRRNRSGSSQLKVQRHSQLRLVECMNDSALAAVIDSSAAPVIASSESYLFDGRMTGAFKT